MEVARLVEAIARDFGDGVAPFGQQPPEAREVGCAGQAGRIKPIPLERMTEMYAKGTLNQVVH